MSDKNVLSDEAAAVDPNETATTETPNADAGQIWKLAIDVGPLLLFFGAYLVGGIYWATGVLMVAMLVAVVVARVVFGHVSATLIATTLLVVVFGAMTLWLHDPRFIKMKPTIINLVFAVVLMGGLMMDRLLLKTLLGQALNLTEEGWRRLTVRWAIFFVGLAALNEFVWRNFSEGAWASFKVFGILPLTMIFFALQWGFIKKHTPQL